MLEKTLALLKDIPPGNPAAPDRPCYDEAEIEQLGYTLRALLYSPFQLRARLEELGVSLVPANFYSEIPTIREIEDAEITSPAPLARGFDQHRMLDLLTALLAYAAEFDPPRSHPTPDRFSWTGGPFSHSDAMAYYSFVRHLRPRTIVEIGSGWSTLVADAALRANGSGRIICVDRYPEPFLANIGSVAAVIERPAQELTPAQFNEHLTDGDFVFIDSTHTVKHGSDCLHLYLRVLPEIERGIIVHAHDIFLPFGLPSHWLRDRQIYWTEQYLLYAYLMDNPRTEVLYGSAYHHHHNPEQLKRFMYGRYDAGGGSLWFAQSPRNQRDPPQPVDWRARAGLPNG